VDQSKTSWSIRRARQTSAAVCVILLGYLSMASIEAQNTPGLRKLVYKVAPKYPRELKQNAIGGVVRLSISINPNGSVTRISPHRGQSDSCGCSYVAVKPMEICARRSPDYHESSWISFRVSSRSTAGSFTADCGSRTFLEC